jgi:antitoxin (DNA-binding transcriptional repressor) of toxin-antitoxin stability system
MPEFVYTIVCFRGKIPSVSPRRDMKTATIREFRSNIAELLAGEESVLVTKHGKPAAVVYPLGNPKMLPLEIRRKLYLAMAGEIAKQLDATGVSEEQIEREFTNHKKRRRR